MIQKAGPTLVAAAALIIGIFLPSFAFWVQDCNVSEQVFTESLLRATERESLYICHMLRMAYVTDKQFVLSRGKYLTAEEAFTQAKRSLAGLDTAEILPISWDTCTLQDEVIVFRISKEDLSKRMILWLLSVETADGAAIRITLDDNTGMVLGFSYTNEVRPFYATRIPPLESQLCGQAAIRFFSEYWNVSVISNSVISDSGEHMLTVADHENNLCTELPFALSPTGFRINISS